MFSKPLPSLFNICLLGHYWLATGSLDFILKNYIFLNPFNSQTWTTWGQWFLCWILWLRGWWHWLQIFCVGRGSLTFCVCWNCVLRGTWGLPPGPKHYFWERGLCLSFGENECDFANLWKWACCNAREKRINLLNYGCKHIQ